AEAGSVVVHNQSNSAIELTDLGVHPKYQQQGLGQNLIASALRAGQRMGKTRVSLSSGDNGTGRLTAWYKRMGFRQTGVDSDGQPRLEGPIARILSGIAQRKVRTPMPAVPVLQRSSMSAAEAAQLNARYTVTLAAKLNGVDISSYASVTTKYGKGNVEH